MIRKNPLFEIYIESNHLVINNNDYIKDNCVINLNDILSVERIKTLSLFNRIIEVYFGFLRPSKSDIFRIHLKNGFKDVLLTECDIKKTDALIYEINHEIIKQANKTKPI